MKVFARPFPFSARGVCCLQRRPEVASHCGTAELVDRAWRARAAVPGFNIPYLPMMEPVVRALRDTRCFGLIMVARLEWRKFESGSLEAVRDEYERCGDVNHTRLHLDHVPVVDEDGDRVDYLEIIRRAVDVGYGSVMVDGSRLSLEENIACTREAVGIARAGGVPLEAELGAVMGHEDGPLPPYEELFRTGRGFTDPGEASRFVRETGADWLSVAVGNIHGAISAAARGREKPRARLDIDHLSKIADAIGRPAVLHGGTGIPKRYVLDAVGRGIAKINLATVIRQPYERSMGESVGAARDAVYRTVCRIVRDDMASVVARVSHAVSSLQQEGHERFGLPIGGV
jgi:fructose-bisphosphate aldolase class II